MRVLITGGTGLIGSSLTEFLLKKGHEVVHLSRKPAEQAVVRTYHWDIRKGYIEDGALDGIDVIVHLAGAGIADKKWSPKQKELILSSRVDSAELLLDQINKRGTSLKVFISASGISYYGLKTVDHIFSENDPPSEEFIGDVCVKWEAAADKFTENSRVVKLRTGIVLAKNGGALEKIIKPIRFGFGAPLGTGSQWVPYIHLHDLVRMYYFCMVNEVECVFNAVNGDHITNSDLTKAAAKTLGKPLWLPNVPSFVLKMIFGEMGDLVLEGSRVSSDKMQGKGFSFDYPNLGDTLRDLLKS